MRPTSLPAAAFAAALLALAGCKNAIAPGEKPWAFGCPDPGTRVTWDDGRTLVFAGADPAAPAVCLARPAGGGGEGPPPVRLAWGMVEESNGSEGRGHVTGMRGLFPAKAGSNAKYTATVSSPGSGIQYPFETSWRMLGFETVTVPAGRFDAVAFERRVQGTGANASQSYVARYWLEGVSGVVLKRTVEVGRGGSTLLRDIQAKELALPPPPPRQPPPAGAPAGAPPG
jgi:hypothetical protein